MDMSDVVEVSVGELGENVAAQYMRVATAMLRLFTRPERVLSHLVET